MITVMITSASISPNPSRPRHRLRRIPPVSSPSRTSIPSPPSNQASLKIARIGLRSRRHSPFFPDQSPGAHPNLSFSRKEEKIYVINRDNHGRFNSTTDNSSAGKSGRRQMAPMASPPIELHVYFGGSSDNINIALPSRRRSLLTWTSVPTLTLPARFAEHLRKRPQPAARLAVDTFHYSSNANPYSTLRRHQSRYTNYLKHCRLCQRRRIRPQNRRSHCPKRQSLFRYANELDVYASAAFHTAATPVISPSSQSFHRHTFRHDHRQHDRAPSLHNERLNPHHRLDSYAGATLSPPRNHQSHCTAPAHAKCRRQPDYTLQTQL